MRPAVPHRLEELVGEPQPEDVQHHRHAEEVVDAEHLLLGHQLRDQAVERARRSQVGAEGLLQREPGALGQVDLAQRRAHLRRHGGRQREVDDGRVVAGGDQLLAAWPDR